jgi:hypothetical protein
VLARAQMKKKKKNCTMPTEINGGVYDFFYFFEMPAHDSAPPARRTSLFRFGIIKVLICLFASKKMLESEVPDRLSVNP